MKHSFHYSSAFALIGVCILLVTGDVRAGGMSSDYRAASNAQLEVWRAADFGYWISLNLYIDGIQLTRLGWGEGYQALVRPGDHVLSIITTPSPFGKTRVTKHRVHMNPGETYKFTALWKEAELPVLETGHVGRAYPGSLVHN